jgi:two-component system, NarL family, nitrate/nitrite response regulator NarL
VLQVAGRGRRRGRLAGVTRRSEAATLADVEERPRRRIVVLDAAPMVARLAADVLSAGGFDVRGTAPTGREGLALARRERPDVALVDLALPDAPGEEVIAALRRDFPGAVCIALTAVDIPARVLGALRAGAAGYILKPFHASELARAVEEVLSGEAAPISPRVAKVLLSELRGDPPDQRGGPALSKRELEVLELLVHGHTYADVAAALGIAEGTVQTYVKRIYEKLDAGTRLGAPRADRRDPRDVALLARLAFVALTAALVVLALQRLRC